jgi:hypothetical protein
LTGSIVETLVHFNYSARRPEAVGLGLVLGLLLGCGASLAATGLHTMASSAHTTATPQEVVSSTTRPVPSAWLPHALQIFCGRVVSPLMGCLRGATQEALGKRCNQWDV